METGSPLVKTRIDQTVGSLFRGHAFARKPCNCAYTSAKVFSHPYVWTRPYYKLTLIKTYSRELFFLVLTLSLGVIERNNRICQDHIKTISIQSNLSSNASRILAAFSGVGIGERKDSCLKINLNTL